jgi:hypothetical protein
MIDPFERATREMYDAGFDLDKIPREKYDEHIWADGLLLWWSKHHELPTAFQLASDMFDEWDDPVSTDEAEEIIKCLTSS